MRYVDINEAIKMEGLRIVIVKAMPSAWGVAAKALIEFKEIDFAVAHQIPMAENPELLAWSGVNSGPVVAWNEEQPINRWNDILFLLERLNPQKQLVPENPAERISVLGLSHEICGELGFGWNRRLDLIRPGDDGMISDFAKKYGYTKEDAAVANTRVIRLMKEMTRILRSQRGKGSDYFVGTTVTAVDFYWAAFSNFVSIQPQEVCPMNPDARPMFENTPAEIIEAIDPILIEHRDRIMDRYYKIPLEL
ncbi:MAG: hypothetical protein VX986_02080 [Pseudomonadota bacterium]|nr:hypothetical protein [Pseudomonadota bacterium]